MTWRHLHHQPSNICSGHKSVEDTEIVAHGIWKLAGRLFAVDTNP